MTEPNLYNVGYDVGFEDGFKEAQARVLDDLGDDPEIMAASRAEWAARAKTAEAKLKSMAMDNIAADLSSEVSADRIKELEERLKAATDDAKGAEAYAEEIYAHAKELETKLDRASKMLPRAFSAIHKDRKQEVIDVLETAIEQLTGGKDD